MVSELGKKFIKSFEGLRLVAYLDTGGVYTIGYGTIAYPNRTRVKKGDKCTLQQAEEYFTEDLETFEAVVDRLVKSNMTQNQYDMTCSICYNIGATAFKNSTLLKVLNMNADDKTNVSKQWMRWIYDNGNKVTGLENRRKAELKIYFS